ncbi:hypothetical protein EKO27_g3625 [Xylaria grammica]|uniref:Receptor L-domain domain-containing protein n=1 Tax=Xylaria grammica TaxID=363999 RepID=A0A439DAP2_9PEZI|nr:hypothetical protein EKO27_g3625 [Xylaria grammica]
MSLSMSPLWLSVDYCDINVTITTQADIESLHATPYEFCFNNVTITNAEGTLTFDNFTQVNGLYVQDSPNLEALSFPDLGRLSALGVYDALALSNISLPEIQSVGLLPFGGGGWSLPPPWPGTEDRSLIGVTINNAPALKTIDFDFLSGFFTLELVGADGLTDFGPTGYDEGILRRINSSDTLSVDGCFNLANVQFARFVQITGRTDCEYLMLNYHSAYNLTLIDTAHSRLDILAPFAVNGTLVADSLQLSPENSSSYDPQPLYFISSIGEDAHLLSGANVDLSLDEVETLGGSLVASNNKNCTFSFDKLSEVKGNISMTDNPDSALPWFPDLRRAANIELRGNINTSHGPNIFPALTTVPGTVTIEAWNSDFNCSQLVKQMQAGIIQNLVCNGTDGTQGDTSGSPSSPAGGAWTILGVAVGIMVLQNTIPVW